MVMGARVAQNCYLLKQQLGGSVGTKQLYSREGTCLAHS